MNTMDHRLYYFLGIGGIGMSALARYYRHFGKEVAGYDRNATTLTTALENEGIPCHYSPDVLRLQAYLAKYRKEEILVIYTPAIPAENPEFQYLLRSGLRMIKRSEALGGISTNFKTIAIAGTHGKTTTTTLISHLLKTAGINCFSFMGGISKNYNTNLLLGDATRDAFIVVEADEYDRSFLTLRPYIAVITSVDADHLDVYGDASHVREGYTLFAGKVLENGILIVKKNVDNDLSLTQKRLTYSLNLDTEYCAGKVIVENAQFYYDIKSPVESISRATLGLPGLHNVENSIAAVAVVQQLGVSGEVIKEGLRSFKGVRRRFDYRVETQKVIYIDDYAHHPEEIRATISSVKKLYPGKKITGIFQPHLFSRTRDFADGFAGSLAMLDKCLLLDIYPAREKPVEGISSAWLLEKIDMKNKKLVSKDELLDEIENQRHELILTMGAGDIEALVPAIENILKRKIEKDQL